MPQNWYCHQGLLGHPVLWTKEEAIAAIATWTIDPKLEQKAIWPRTKHNVPLGDNNSILMAPSVTSTMPSRATCFRTGLANKIVGGPASLNRSGHGRNFHTRSALVTRQMSAAAVLWVTFRESLAPAMRCATLEVILLQLAMLVDISPKVDQVNSHDGESDVASVCRNFALRICASRQRTNLTWNRLTGEAAGLAGGPTVAGTRPP